MRTGKAIPRLGFKSGLLACLLLANTVVTVWSSAVSAVFATSSGCKKANETVA